MSKPCRQFWDVSMTETGEYLGSLWSVPGPYVVCPWSPRGRIPGRDRPHLGGVVCLLRGDPAVKRR